MARQLFYQVDDAVHDKIAWLRRRALDLHAEYVGQTNQQDGAKKRMAAHIIKKSRDNGTVVVYWAYVPDMHRAEHTLLALKREDDRMFIDNTQRNNNQEPALGVVYIYKHYASFRSPEWVQATITQTYPNGPAAGANYDSTLRTIHMQHQQPSPSPSGPPPSRPVASVFPRPFLTWAEMQAAAARHDCFIPAATWHGQLPAYAFGRGDDGAVGYRIDAALASGGIDIDARMSLVTIADTEPEQLHITVSNENLAVNAALLGQGTVYPQTADVELLAAAARLSPFIPAATWRGQLHGYAFGRGDDGAVGYRIDAVLASGGNDVDAQNEAGNAARTQ